MQIKFKGDKTGQVKQLILAMLDVLSQIGLPLRGLSDRRLEHIALTTLAVGGIKHNLAEALSSNDGRYLKTREIIEFENRYLGENISSGSYDDIRRKHIALQVEAGCIVSSALFGTQATNDPARGYSLSPIFADLLRQYSTPGWESALRIYKIESAKLPENIKSNQRKAQIPITLPDGLKLRLSTGEHNRLQKAIIERFLPTIGMGAEVLYVGDTANKCLYVNEAMLKEIGFYTIGREELPDVIAYTKARNLLFLIEAVHSSGPISELRLKTAAAPASPVHRQRNLLLLRLPIEKSSDDLCRILHGKRRFGLPQSQIISSISTGISS